MNQQQQVVEMDEDPSGKRNKFMTAQSSSFFADSKQLRRSIENIADEMEPSYYDDYDDQAAPAQIQYQPQPQPPQQQQQAKTNNKTTSFKTLTRLKTWRSDTNLSSNLTYLNDGDDDLDDQDAHHRHHNNSYQKMNRSDLDNVGGDEEFNDGEEEDGLLYNQRRSNNNNNNNSMNSNKRPTFNNNHLGSAKMPNGFNGFNSQHNNVIKHQAKGGNHHSNYHQVLMSQNSNSWENSNGGFVINDQDDTNMMSQQHQHRQESELKLKSNLINSGNNSSYHANDIYKLAKKNYKLMHDSRLAKSAKPPTTTTTTTSAALAPGPNISSNYLDDDSQTSSALLNQSSSNLDESNYSEIFNETEPSIYTSQQRGESLNNENFVTKQAGRRQARGGLETYIPNNLNDSISNWSMKISNCQAPATRSMSRSPLPHSCSSSQYYQNVYGVLASPNELNRHYDLAEYDQSQLQQHMLQQQQQRFLFNTQHSKSTTSWGKLKHSKSILSNRADEIQTSSECESTKLPPTYQQQQQQQQQNTVNKHIQFYNELPAHQQQFMQESSNHSDVNSQFQNENQHRNIYEQTSSISSASSPSLFKLFQYSKFNSSQINGPIGNDMAQSNNSNHRNHGNENTGRHRDDQRLSRQEQLLAVNLGARKQAQTKKTSFSQMSRRSRSSCALSNPNDYSTEMDDDYKPFNAAQPRAIDQSIQTSQVVWAPGDHRRKAQEPQPSLSMYQTNMSKLSSLPDLTFLKDYGDENGVVEASAVNRKNSQLARNYAEYFAQERTVSEVPARNYSPYDPYPPMQRQQQLQQQQQQQQQVNMPPVGSDLLKRKTLKSIKRYRQTKQNTEPCVLNENQVDVTENSKEHQDYLYFMQQQQPPAARKMFNPYADHQVVEVKREQPVLVPKGYMSKPLDDRYYTAENQRGRQPAQRQQYPTLKSCLKRNEPDRRAKSSKPASSRPLINFDYCAFVKENDTETMFVPFVGYLFTLDSGSSTRYNYYNNLERYRAIKSYRQILTLCQRGNPNRDVQDELAEGDEEDEFENEFNNGGNIKMNRLYHDYLSIFARSNSEADLSCSKRAARFDSAKSKAKKQPVYFAEKRPRSASLTTQRTAYTSIGSINNSSSNESSATAPNSNHSQRLGKPMPTSKSESYRMNQTDAAGAAPSPLLQYDNLIKMLKSNSIGKELKTVAPKKPAAPAPPGAFNAIQDLRRGKAAKSVMPASTAKVGPLKSNSNAAVKMDDSANYIKIAQVIDADSISLASLSESPPSEFKFSDDEDHRQNGDDNHSSSVSKPRLDVNDLANKMANAQVDMAKAKLNELSMTNTKQRVRERHFHNILLQEPKLNSLKEILSELKQYNSINIPINHFCSIENLSISHSTATSVDVKVKIERLSLNLFDFLKQGLKPVSLDAEMPSTAHGMVTKSYESASNLTMQCTQYTQLWNLIENVINANLTQEALNTTSSSSSSSASSSFKNNNNNRRTRAATAKGAFHLPKEVYLTMFQEINRYAKTISQTFLIDSDSTSQLRRKHNYMVMLKTLKYKFQLFILNLLNHKQLARFFKYLKKERSLLSRFYDLKYPPLKNGAKVQTSSDSNSSVESLTTIVESVVTDKSSSAVSSPSTLASLANVSVFENDDYFDYFYKTLEQFNTIEINLESLREVDSVLDHTTTTSSTGSTDTTVKQFRSHAAQPSVPKFGATRFNLAEKGDLSGPGKKLMNDSKSFNNLSAAAGQQNHHPANANTNGFILKNISKRLNIKSWFASSSNANNVSVNGQVTSPPQAATTQSPPSSISSQSSFAQSSSYTSSSSSSNVNAVTKPTIHRYMGANTSAVIKLNDDAPTRVLPDLVNASDKASSSSKTVVKNKKKASKGGLQMKLRSLSNPMKHSISEPSLNN